MREPLYEISGENALVFSRPSFPRAQTPAREQQGILNRLQLGRDHLNGANLLLPIIALL
jgi:hypothetical protein